MVACDGRAVESRDRQLPIPNILASGHLSREEQGEYTLSTLNPDNEKKMY